MVKVKIVFLLFTLTLLCTGCIEDTIVIKENTTVVPENTISADSVKDYDIAAANNAFAFDMYSQLAQLESGNESGNKRNVFFFSTQHIYCHGNLL